MFLRRNHLSTILFIFHTIIINTSYSQTIPANNDTLNYSEVLFRFPWVDKIDSYKLELIPLDDLSKKQTYQLTNNTFIAKNLNFNQKYIWRYTGVSNSGDITGWSDSLTFFIGSSFGVDPLQTRYRVLSRNRKKAAPGLLFFDYAEVAVNRNGEPKWYVPHISGIKDDARLRDLKMTENGTFTAIFNMEAIEFDRDGNIIWQAPNDGQVSGIGQENYHHEFTKLNDTSYLVLGSSKEFKITPEGNDSVEVETGSVIIYNKEGKVIWLWDSKNYFSDKELFLRRRRNGFYETMTHMNSCTVNDSLVIVGFRDISRIVIIDRATGKVLESYGGFGFIEEPHSASGFFRRQHSGHLLSDGNLAVLNNDSVIDPMVVSSAVIFSRISANNPESEKIFEFKFDFDTLTNGKSQRTGNIIEMENGNLLIYMGVLNRCVEVTRDSKVVADMFIEKFDVRTKSWIPFPQYRVFYERSLYPYEFTARILKKEIVKKDKKVSLRLFNIGAKNDRYDIILLKNGEKEILKTVEIEAGQTTDIELVLSKKENLTIQIEANHSLHLEKFYLPKK